MMKSEIIAPPRLQKGDTIGLICPAGQMPLEKMQTCIKTLHSWGYQVKCGQTPGRRKLYFSGTDEERLHDLQLMLDDPEVNAILCARGGYGCSRIIDRVNWTTFRKNPKWLIGFSDVTVFHSYLLSRLRIMSLHAPMAGAFQEENGKSASVLSLKKALKGTNQVYRVQGHPFNKKGEASGMLMGGNLSLLAHQIGTPSDIRTNGAILFLEDVGEYLYNIDRMLLQLDRAGKLSNLAGLIIGGFTDGKDTVPPFGQTAEEIIASRVARYGYPVCFGFPVSHGKENMALTVGARYSLTVKNTVTLKQIT